MKTALKAGTLDLPAKYEAARSRFEKIIAGADRKPVIRDASKDVLVRLNKQIMVSPEFMELWQKIKQKTAYRVSIVYLLSEEASFVSGEVLKLAGGMGIGL